MELRRSESIELFYFAFMLALSFRRPLNRGARGRAWGLGLFGVGAVLLAALSPRFLSELPSSVIRDWLPAPLILVAYWQAGAFFQKPLESFNRLLLRLDGGWLGRRLDAFSSGGAGRALAVYSELFYVLCYPMPPLGLAALYLMHIRHHVDLYWTVVLVPPYVCYLLVPLVPTLPPRLRQDDAVKPPTTSLARRLNLWILRHASIQANTFPSAHVAATFAVAFVLLTLVPLVGVFSLWVATSIAIATVIGRYHYVADAVLGSALALGWYLIALHGLPWSSLYR